MGIRKIKRIIKCIIIEIIKILCLTLFFLGIFWCIAVITEFFVPIP